MPRQCLEVSSFHSKIVYLYINKQHVSPALNFNDDFANSRYAPWIIDGLPAKSTVVNVMHTKTDVRHNNICIEGNFKVRTTVFPRISPPNKFCVCWPKSLNIYGRNQPCVTVI